MYSNDIGKINSRTPKKQLIELTQTKGGPLEKRINAINVLATKRDVDPRDFFGKVLKDDQEQAVVKSNMVLRLGHRLKSVRALEKFFGDNDVVVNRSILQVLAYHGDAKSIEKINAFTKGKQKNSPEIKKAQFAKTMISYRLGDNKEILASRPSKDFESFRGMEAEPIKKQSLTRPKATKILAQLDPAFMAVPLTAEKAQQLKCQGKSLTILLSEAIATKTYDFETNGIVASIVEDDYCPGGHFIKYHVLMANVAKDGTHPIHIINSNGRVLMEGSATNKEQTFSFGVKALKRAGSTPVQFEASFKLSDATLEVSEAKSGVGIRKSSRLSLRSAHKD